MAETVLWLAILTGLLVVNGLAIWLLPPVFGLKRLRLRQAAVAVSLVAVWAVALSAAGWALASRLPAAWLTVWLLLGALAIVGGLGLLRLALWASWREALRAGLVLVVSSAIVAGLSVVPLCLSYRAYASPTNGMAPTLKGRHFAGKCPHCGGPTVVSFFEQTFPPGRVPADIGICEQCLQVGPAAGVVENVRTSDRFIVRQLATPRRWDLVVFRFPGARRQLYVQRLVALPGESVEVKDGGIWINGSRLTPPPEIADLQWFVPEDEFSIAKYANAGSPLRLGADEYFMLGDFSPRSSDSRFFGPVAKDDLVGVVGCVYFPPRSWRAFPRHEAESVPSALHAERTDR
jgi:signal peptidase I